VPLAIALHIVALRRLRAAAQPTKDQRGQVLAAAG
jgi:hypothetical protein